MTKWRLVLCFQGGLWYTKVRIHPSHMTEQEVHDAMWDEARACDIPDSKCLYIGTFHSEPAKEDDEDTG